jgi:endonuclease/exonuclease/phosphatase family metal-dependent hydrolase
MENAMRVVTLNLWHDDPPLQQRLAVAAAWLRSLKPDVVFLQEVNPIGTVPQALADQAGFPFVALGRRIPTSVEGVAILSRTPIRDIQVFSLPGSEAPDWDRVLLSGTVDIDGTPVGVHTTHLNWSSQAGPVREQQVAAILGVIGAGVHVLAGDFNSTPNSPEIKALERAGFVDVGPSDPTWASRNPGVPRQAASLHLDADRKIDYVFVRGASASSSRLAFDSPTNGVYASDHFGVSADIAVGSRASVLKTVLLVAATTVIIGGAAIAIVKISSSSKTSLPQRRFARR